MVNLIGFILRNFQIFILIKVALFFYTSYQSHLESIKTFQDQLDSIDIKKVKSNKLLEDSKEFNVDLQTSKQRVLDVEKDIQQVQQSLPENIVDTEILDMFSGEAKSLNIKEIYLTPRGEENRGFYFAKKYEFKAKGTYLQFLVFFEVLSEKDRLINIKSLNIENVEDRQKGRFQVVKLEAIIEVFRYNSAHKNDEIEA